MKPTKLLFAAALAIIMTSIVYAQDTTFTVTDSGSVGIGTTTPAAKLEVADFPPDRYF